MKASDRDDEARLWSGRLNAAGHVLASIQPNWTRLEDALAGIFPRVVPRKIVEKDGTSGWEGDDEQINVNVTLAVASYMTALAFDDQPRLNWSRFPDEPSIVVAESERLAMMLMDDADAVMECRRAMRYMMTRGPWINWLSVDRVCATPEEVRASMIPPEEFVLAARTGTLKELPYGVDYYKIGVIARDEIEDPAKALQYTPEERARIGQLAETCEAQHQKRLKLPRAIRMKARINVEATPYGTHCRWDPTVTDVRRARWAARKIIMSRDEFLADPAFTDEAKDEIEPLSLRNTKDAPETFLPDAPPDKALEENGRIVLWQIHDRAYRKMHYVSEGKYCGLVEKDDKYPFLDAEGEPLFPDFYPMVVRTPIQHNREKPEQSLGIPFLAPGWPIQLEIIRTRSAYYNACKRAARIAVASSKVDDKTLAAYEAALDGTVIKPSAGYNPNEDGPLFERVDMGQAPLDYLQASVRLMADYANVSRVPLAALTGEPVADTLGQEEMAMKGAAVTQTDVIRNLESGYAELARKAFILFKTFASDDEFVGYLGKSSLNPTKDGVPLFQAVKAMGIDGRKMVAKFASSVRAEDLARQKQRMDFYALSMGPLGRDSTMMPFFDGKSQLINIAKEMEIEGLVPYEPSTAELLAAALTKVMGAQGGQPGNNGESGDKTGRKAGGERGAPAIPNRQDRAEAPPGKPQMQGAAMRPMNATA